MGEFLEVTLISSKLTLFRLGILHSFLCSFGGTLRFVCDTLRFDRGALRLIGSTFCFVGRLCEGINIGQTVVVGLDLLLLYFAFLLQPVQVPHNLSIVGFVLSILFGTIARIGWSSAFHSVGGLVVGCHWDASCCRLGLSKSLVMM
jgi:hypothetical protein